MEFVELPREVHPYYVSTQAHPEFKSRPHRAHPLFAGLVGAAIERQRESRLVEVERPRDDRRRDRVSDVRVADELGRPPRGPARASTPRSRMHGLVWDVVRDEVDLGEAGEVTREYVRHPGAVAVAALDDRAGSA